MDVGTFQKQFLAFRETDPDVVAAAIARATRMVSATVWGALADDGIALLAAHYLQLDPSGTTTELKADKTSTYWVQFDEMRRSVVIGIGVAGGCGSPGSGGWGSGWP